MSLGTDMETDVNDRLRAPGCAYPATQDVERDRAILLARLLIRRQILSGQEYVNLAEQYLRALGLSENG